MTSRLPPVLSRSDLPMAELTAVRLDGELVAVGDGFSPSDLPDSAVGRAQSLLPLLSDRLIVELLTAAWVFGAIDDPPSVHTLCSSADARAKPVVLRGMTVREVVIDDDELVRVGNVAVTSPLRTACDLARCADRFGTSMQSVVCRLLEVGGAQVEDCITLLDRRRNLPGKRRTLSRLRSLAAVRPVSAVAHPVHVVDRVDPPHRVQHPVQVGGVPHLEHEFAESQPV